jgi:hypothetical protein
LAGSEPAPLVVVVSGLPRSGTSLLMQVLAAGGLPALADTERPADVSNPRGYLEWAPVRSLARHPERIAAAHGRAVKVISALLPALPAGPRYRVVFAERDLREVQASQRAMLARRGAPADDLSEAELARHLARIRAWLAARPGWAVCSVGHRDLVERPAETTARVRDFLAADLAPLGIVLDVAAMAAAVDPSLWRERAG